jgi:Lon protease-like protein
MPNRSLPLFPLPLVLFPGEVRELHIFEPRYRQLLADCGHADGRFGIVPVHPDDPPPPPIGSVGCLARIDQVIPHPDGRANIVVAGEARFRIDAYPDTDRLYFVGAISGVDDSPELDPETLSTLARDVRGRVITYLDVVAQLTEQMSARAIPDDPAGLSFFAAALIGVDVSMKMHLLSLTSALERLRTLSGLLDRGIEEALRQLKLKERAKGNGKRPSIGKGATGP